MKSGIVEMIRLYLSPSMRREWIEIDAVAQIELSLEVSLHAEGVD